MFLHSVNLWNLAFYALMVFMATLGLWDVFFDFEENKCSMSYMFEYPEYQVSFLPLFAWALQTRAPPAWPSCGVPLLWLPAPFRRPHPNLTSFPRPGRLCRTPLSRPPYLPFVSFIHGGWFPRWFPCILPAPFAVAPLSLRPLRDPKCKHRLF